MGSYYYVLTVTDQVWFLGDMGRVTPYLKSKVAIYTHYQLRKYVIPFY